MRPQYFKVFKTLSFILAILITSCKNEPKSTPTSSPSNNEAEVPSKLEASGKEKLKMLQGEESKTYTYSSDCNTFYESIDFSSLCFTSEKTPKIQPTKNSSGNNCQYKILLDDFGTEIYVLVNYHDYENSVYNDPEKARLIHQQTFKRQKKSKILFTKTIDTNIEDESYFGYHEGNKQQSLYIRLGNVVIAIQVEGAHKTNPCLLSESELKKFAKLIIDRIKS